MTLRTVVVAGVAAVLLLTGCGGGSGGPAGGGTAGGGTAGGGTAGGGTASRNTDERSAFLAVARCMREHGYPSFPDPVVDSQGHWNFPASGQDHQNAPAACEQVVRRAKSSHRNTGDRKQMSAADIARARSFARCMREHGVSDFPDPDASGGFLMPARLRPPNGAALLRGPERACRQYIPSKGIKDAGGR
jgi:hypothetical protein